MSIELIDIVRIIAAFQFLLVSFFLLSQKKGKRLSNQIFSAFLFSKALSILSSLVIFLDIYHSYPHLSFIGVPLSFLYGPLVYFYTKSSIYSDFTLKKSHIFHLIPCILITFYLIMNYYTLDASYKREIISSGSVYSNPGYLITNSLLLFQVFAYLIASIYILKLYRSEIKKTHSNIKDINLSWLCVVLFGFLLIWVVGLSSFIMRRMFNVSSVFSDFFDLLLIFIFANIIVYKGLKQPEIFSGIEERSKYEQSTLTQSDSESYLKKLKAYMEKEKPYLNPMLTINQLARKLLIPSRHLSQVINEHLNQNFYDFINSYRIKEAKHCLLDSTNNDRTIIQIILDVGFNSKSAFHRAFKKYTGMTPSEFKKLE